MGRRKITQQDRENKDLLIKMASYVNDTIGINYTNQAARLEARRKTFNVRRLTDLRNREEYYPTQKEVDVYRDVFASELAGFGQPDARQQEIDRLLEIVSRQGEELEKVREALYTVLLREGWTEKEALERVLALLEQARAENRER